MKKLLTVGCSFSDIMRNDGQLWPTFLSKKIEHALHSYGKSAMGNHYISTTALHEVQTLLNSGVDSKDILVGVQWSGILRKEIFKNLKWETVERNAYNDYRFATSKKFSGDVDDVLDPYIKTLQSILLTQYFLEKNNIKYFMFSMTDLNVDFLNDNTHINNLFLQINKNNWLPCKGMYEWAFGESATPKDIHPSSEQNLEFTEQVILPWLKENYDCF